MTEIGKSILNSPVAHAIDIIGNRWTFLIIRDLFLGRHRFEEFIQYTGASRATLTKRLKALVEDGIIYRNPYQTAPRRFEYRLTDKGLALYFVALANWRWEHDWANTSGSGLPPRLYHEKCGKTFVPVTVCKRCEGPVSIDHIRFTAGPGANAKPGVKLNASRRSKVNPDNHRGNDSTMFHSSDLFCDRWTPLVLAAFFYGLHRYDDIYRELDIATNILADRLKLLVENGMLDKRAYQNTPARYEYKLTQKGRDYYFIPLALHQWAEAWLPLPKERAVILRHHCSSEPLKIKMVCDKCNGDLLPHDVSLERSGGLRRAR